MSLPVVHIEGPYFRTPDGKTFHYVGVSSFGLFKRWLMASGPTHLVAPILDEWKAVAKVGGYEGPIVLRVFRYAASWNAFGIDPWSYNFEEITKFTNFCGENGFYVDWTCGDSQEVLPEAGGPRGQQQHLNQTCAALVPCTNAFVETCNEPFKNGIDVESVVPPKWGTYLRDSGAYGEIQNWPWAANLDFVSYHGGREDGGLVPWPKWLIDMDDQGSVLLNHIGKPAVLKEPIGAAEVDQPGRRSSNPALFARMGLTAAYCGILFHSNSGLAAEGLGPVQKKCAEAFFLGVSGAVKL